MSDVRLWQAEESFKDLYRIYKPKDIDKFTKDFIKKYKISKEYEPRLKSLIRSDSSAKSDKEIL